MATVTEIAPDIFRISFFADRFGLEFNEFIIRDEQPMLFHTGPRKTFGEIFEAARRVIDPSKLRWIGFSHFESDECGALNEWLAVAPDAQPVCGVVAANVCINDFSDRPARALQHDEVVEIGRYRMRYQRTPHVPHCWDAGLMFEETGRTLFCSDLFGQRGQHPPMIEGDIVGPAAESMRGGQMTPMADSMPYTPYTGRLLAGLAELRPATLAIMHGPAWRGDGSAAILALAGAIRDVYGHDTLAK
jgi:flavorubredoxin